MKAKLEAGESPALDPLVPTPYQALVQAGLGLGPADRQGSLRSTRYLLREAMAQVQDRLAGWAGAVGTLGRTHVPHSASFPQDSAPAVSSRKHWTTRHPSAQGSPPGETAGRGWGQGVSSAPLSPFQPAGLSPQRHCTVRWLPEPRLHAGLCPP